MRLRPRVDPHGRADRRLVGPVVAKDDAAVPRRRVQDRAQSPEIGAIALASAVRIDASVLAALSGAPSPVCHCACASLARSYAEVLKPVAARDA